MTALRPELEALPARLARLPVDERGYPVPWFVAWSDGKPEFRAMDPEKWLRAVQERRCWVCGDPLGAYLAFLIGPMCGVNRTTAEPPCHRECAEWSARNCPFMRRPQMVRREDAAINNDHLREQSAGTALARNPGVGLVWITRQYRVFHDGTGKPLIRIGEPIAVTFWAHGRVATRAEIVASVESGLPALMDLAVEQDQREACGAVAELLKMRATFDRLLPAA